ncbi:26S proteasome regulatory complex, subunit RPN2/PSMD1 [Phaffia rhodozyma]|uniref:26S proteasome regulatory subunit RPN2 n=1 Tax=Phaffia rhodozyma TaxID=264483 RepID=A0A0F7SWE1_PHARH|nr:26S proteasome regulatory complex, subunit RPN2/PSMD1 [Phaffia rhodozyma]
MPVSVKPSSAAGLLALLSEQDSPELQTYALENLNEVIDQFWPEISEEVVSIETLSESSELSASSRSLAALLASKVYYHLGAYDEALSFALAAGDRFEAERKLIQGSGLTGGEGYVEVVLTKSIDTYIQQRSLLPPSAFSDPSSSTSQSTIDPRLETLVLSVLSVSLDQQEWRQSLGIALESRRLDVVRTIWEKSGKDGSILRWVLEIVGSSSNSSSGSTKGKKGKKEVKGWGKEFKQEVLRLLLELFPLSPSSSSSGEADAVDYASITQIHILLNQPSLSTELIKSIVAKGEDDEKNQLGAYQVAFDLADGATQEFLGEVGTGVCGEVKSENEHIVITNLRSILSGEKTIRYYLDFLYKNNHADLLIIQKTKEAFDSSRSSMYHSALTLSHSFMSAGTTSDTFLRRNLDWLGRASNWSKFTATAALGVIHKGNLSKGMTILGPYLPGSAGAGAGGAGKEYSEGGSLFALGLINSGRGTTNKTGENGETVGSYLRKKLGEAGGEEVVQHGAALGLGVAGMASGNEEIYDQLRETLFQDSAVAGEASGYAMGLVMLGTASSKAYDEMIQYAHETQHEKIIRGLAIGTAFLYYNKEEEADEVIERLVAEKDAILRYGGIYTIAMAYAGTSNNKAIRKVLDVAVSDVSDDVRRAAVTALGFILCRNPTQVPRIVQLLSESYNPHVRQGAALALGVACAGTGLEEAVELLEPLSKDPVDFVRQGALVSLAMVLIQQTEAQNPKVASVRKTFASVITDKHEDSMAKFGAALGQGIIDAGGRNVTISLLSKSGSLNMGAVVGMALFCQFWYWFPLAHCLSLGFTPTAVIGLDKDLKIPKLGFTSRAKPSLYAYPAPTVIETKEVAKPIATAVLSSTAKANARAIEKKKTEAADDKDTAMETDEKTEEAAPDADAKMDDAVPIDESAATNTATTAPASKKKSEPTSETLENMTRVTPAQASSIYFPLTNRYLPVRSDPSSTSSAQAGGKKGAIKIGRGGAGILMVYENANCSDEEKKAEKDFIELEASLDQIAPGPGATVSGGHVAMGAAATSAPAVAASSGVNDEDGPERDPPASFEYPFSS